MDLSGIASLSTALSGARTGDAVDILVQKKAMQMEAQSAAQLIEALPQSTANNPPHLGQNVDVKA